VRLIANLLERITRIPILTVVQVNEGGQYLRSCFATSDQNEIRKPTDYTAGDLTLTHHVFVYRLPLPCHCRQLQ
jgi:hypothetical protein